MVLTVIFKCARFIENINRPERTFLVWREVSRYPGRFVENKGEINVSCAQHERVIIVVVFKHDNVTFLECQNWVWRVIYGRVCAIGGGNQVVVR